MTAAAVIRPNIPRPVVRPNVQRSTVRPSTERPQVRARTTSVVVVPHVPQYTIRWANVIRTVVALPLTTVGDLLGFNGAADRFPIGSNGQILTVDDTEPFGFKWGAPPATSPLTTKGDLYTYDTSNQRLPVGSDGQFLRALASETTGLVWDTLEAGDLPAHAAEHHSGGGDELAHDSIAGSGAASHSTIDAHLNNTSNPHAVSHAQLNGLPGGDSHTQYLLLAGRAGGQTAIGGTLTGQPLTIQDNAVDAQQVAWVGGAWVPGTTAVYDIGEDTTPLRWRTIYLDNDGGNILVCPNVVSGGSPTEYTIWGGGGNFGAEQNQGGTFRIAMAAVGTSLGTSTNKLILTPGTPDWAAGAGHNDVIFEAFNGISTYSFVFEFGGFNNPEYGMQLRRTTGAEISGKSLIFDNQTPVSDFRRSIDFRIGGVNQMTIENSGEVTITNRISAPRADITAIQNGSGIGNLGTPAVTFTGYLNFFGLNWFDYLTFNAQSANLPICIGLFPNGTSTASYVNAYNSSNTGATAWLQMGVTGTAAELLVRDFSQTTNITELNIGSGGNDFPVFDVSCTTLTDINLVFTGTTRLKVQTALMTFGDAFNVAVGTGTGTKLGTAANQKLGLWGATPIVRPTATGAGGHAAVGGANVNANDTFTGGVGATAYTIGDIVAALKNFGALTA